MYVIETTLLVIAYSLIILTLFLQFVCFKRNLERLESIGFTMSLLLLILSFSLSHYISATQTPDSANVFSLGAMTLMGIMTPLHILQERRHKLSSKINQLVLALGVCMLGILVIGYISTRLIHIQYAIAIYLGLSIMASMLLILRTKPIIRKTKQEKIERLFAIAFLILVPLYLYVSFTSDATAGSSSLNITLSLIFIMLSASKLQEDIERLSLFKAGHQVTEQNLSNYGFTKREREIASLLIQGVSYQEIADQLHISMPTVKTHVSNIYRKSQVRNRAALILLLSQPESPNPL